MSSIIALLDGVILAVMIMMNGTLANVYGNYSATVYIHLSGLLMVIIYMIMKKEKLKKATEAVPWYLYAGGAIGVLTVVFNNLTFLHLGVTITLALGLLGQTVFSLLFDQWGVLGTKVIKLEKKKIIGLSLIILGIVAMIFI